MMILLNIAIVLLFIQGIYATTSSNGGSSTIGYQPTSDVEERWVAEEEFHGASSQQHQPKQQKKKKKVKESSSYPGHEHINEQSWWDEDDTDERLSMQEQSAPPSIATKEEKKKTHSKKQKIRIWKNKSTTTKSSVGDDNSSISQTDKKTNEDTNTSTESSTSSSSEYDEEHPMRTDEWQLNIQLSRLYSNRYDMNELFPECYSITDRSTPLKDQNVPDRRRKSSNGYYRKRQVMQFARNGYVKILVDDHDTDSNDSSLRTKKPRVGKWRIGHSGVAFDIPVQISPRRKSKGSSSEQQPRLTTLHYHADIHLNKFGQRPRMFRGVITRDRYASSFLPSNFLRPVLGTFSAEGIGHDTSDTSYRERAISLSRQQVINEAKGDM